MDIETQNLIDDLRAELKQVKDEWQLARDNLLWPALIGPGQLRFGGNIMQLDGHGIQVASAGSQVEALWFVNGLVPDPNTLAVRSSITGTDNGTVATMRFKSQSAGGNIQAYNQATATVLYHIIEVFAAAQSLTTQLTVRTWDTDLGAVLFERMVLGLAQLDADPTTLQDGMIWYRTDTDVIRARINGATVNISTGGGLLTDTAWAAAGDLVYGTGNDTATILSHPGSAGLVLTSTTGPNAISWAAAAGGSFSYGKAITTSQGQNLP